MSVFLARWRVLFLLSGFLLIALAYLSFLPASGVIGPDEARYAGIGRAMAETGDWVVPRLHGRVWLEKPPLLYWLIGAGYGLGLGDDLAPRFFPSLLSVLFMIAFWWLLREEVDDRVALLAPLLLATTPFWIAYSFAAVTDMPMSAFFTLSLLWLLRSLRMGTARDFVITGALLGIAMLGKALVPAALFVPAVPLLWWLTRRRELLVGALWISFGAAAVVLPWALLCYAQVGWELVDELIVKHHFSRFASGALQHEQPFWFYVPVLAGALLPWLPLLFVKAEVTRSPELGEQPNRLALPLFLTTSIFGLLLLSASRNKLPGYVLPLVPSLVVLLAARLRVPTWRPRVMAGVFATLPLFVFAAVLLPEGLRDGLERTGIPYAAIAGSVVAGAVAGWFAGKRWHAPQLIWGAAVFLLLGLPVAKSVILPALEGEVSARSIWRREGMRGCEMQWSRALRYSFEFYARTDCVSRIVEREQP